jgi:LAO/AO transport system kinase
MSLIDELLGGNTRALARAISLVEDRAPEAGAILKALFPHAGRALVLGITGSPGVGKSSLVEQLAGAFRKDHPHVGIVAVDPTSPFTGGAILGDRIRMNRMSTDPGVFIRSMATRGHLGGLAAATADVVQILDAAGQDPILIETVGVGQDEIEIARLADISIVILVPGMGDDVQALKAGIMEIADIFVINKCDRPGVEKMEQAVVNLLSLASRKNEESTWVPPIVKTVATEGKGIGELIEKIRECRQHFQKSPVQLERKRQAARQRLLALLGERTLQVVLDRALPGKRFEQVVDQIARHERDPHEIVDALTRDLQVRPL